MMHIAAFSIGGLILGFWFALFYFGGPTVTFILATILFAGLAAYAIGMVVILLGGYFDAR